MSVGTVHDQHINVFRNEALGSFIIMNSDGRTDPQTSLLVFASVGKTFDDVDVLNRYKALQFLFFVNQQKLLHLFSR